MFQIIYNEPKFRDELFKELYCAIVETYDNTKSFSYNNKARKFYKEIIYNNCVIDKYYMDAFFDRNYDSVFNKSLDKFIEENHPTYHYKYYIVEDIYGYCTAEDCEVMYEILEAHGFSKEKIKVILDNC